MSIDILHRYMRAVLRTVAADTLSDADLRDAYLYGANLYGADLRDAAVPVVPNLHTMILAALETGGTLDMSTWHSTACATTHCRAGWNIALAGKAGKELEDKFGPAVAGALIAVASCPALGGKVPNFYGSNDGALADIRRLAALEQWPQNPRSTIHSTAPAPSPRRARYAALAGCTRRDARVIRAPSPRRSAGGAMEEADYGT